MFWRTGRHLWVGGEPGDEADRLQQLVDKERQQSAANANTLCKQMMDLKSQYEQSLSVQRTICIYALIG